MADVALNMGDRLAVVMSLSAGRSSALWTPTFVVACALGLFGALMFAGILLDAGPFS